MSRALLALWMALVGGLSALQPSVNARLADRVGGFLPSALVSFSVGALALLALVTASGRLPRLWGLADARWWELTGGLIGAVYVASTIVVFPRLGTAAGMASVIAAQLVAGLLLDRAGAFGFERIPLGPSRVLGVGLLILGTVLVLRKG
ncbi:MAG: DMT family transporter [Candidatus Dadabacteria bacterium]|nr:MAG: DMT family transporter [Candidatus Dadabacteria bacterium]